jgi:cell wall-associated NlpC family hydrolase
MVDAEIGFDELKTGDLLFFRGNTWYDKLIEYFGQSSYSHIAILLKDPTWIRSDLKGHFILESGMEDCDDVTGIRRFGVQLVRLEDSLKTSPGCDLFVRHLDVERDAHFYDEIAKIYLDHQRDPYDTSIIDWIEAKFIVNTNSVSWAEHLFFWNNVQKDRRFYCSAFVSYVFCRLGLLKHEENVPWSVIAPKEWTDNGEKILDLNQCSLGSEIKIIQSISYSPKVFEMGPLRAP